MRVKNAVRSVINKLGGLIGAERALRLEARLRFHKNINIDTPVTLSDKICCLEFREKNPLTVQCSDKYEVRKYVEGKGLGNCLVPLIGECCESASRLNFDALPDQFVIKATFGCQMNLICTDKQRLDIAQTKKLIDGWLKKGFNRGALEPHYAAIKKRVICEMYLEDTASLIDYKIHCFNGRPEFILVCTDRAGGLKLKLYDPDWEQIDGIQGKHKGGHEIERPGLLREMLEISEILSRDFKFVRVDLYQIGQKIYFGELTFTPDGGMLSYFTPEFDRQMGKRLRLS